MFSHYVPNLFLQDVPIDTLFYFMTFAQSWTLISDVVLQLFGMQIPFFATCRIFLILFGNGWTKVAHFKKTTPKKKKKTFVWAEPHN
jgi:hypothetical protein